MAQPLIARTIISYAMRNAVKPIQTVKMNMAMRLLSSMTRMISFVLAINIRPPDMRQKAATSSLGGRDGKREVGGEMKKRI